MGPERLRRYARIHDRLCRASAPARRYSGVAPESDLAGFSFSRVAARRLFSCLLFDEGPPCRGAGCCCLWSDHLHDLHSDRRAQYTVHHPVLCALAGAGVRRGAPAPEFVGCPPFCDRAGYKLAGRACADYVLPSVSAGRLVGGRGCVRRHAERLEAVWHGHGLAGAGRRTGFVAGGAALSAPFRVQDLYHPRGCGCGAFRPGLGLCHGMEPRQGRTGYAACGGCVRRRQSDLLGAEAVHVRAALCGSDRVVAGGVCGEAMEKPGRARAFPYGVVRHAVFAGIAFCAAESLHVRAFPHVQCLSRTRELVGAYRVCTGAPKRVRAAWAGKGYRSRWRSCRPSYVPVDIRGRFRAAARIHALTWRLLRFRTSRRGSAGNAGVVVAAAGYFSERSASGPRRTQLP